MDADSKKADREFARQTEKKVLAAKKFLHDHGLQPNIYYLLDVAGASFVKDFVEVDDALLKEIEEQVRNPNFNGGDMSKSERKKYFGCELKEASLFSFAVLDRRKLKKVAEDAREASNRTGEAACPLAMEPNVNVKVSRKRKFDTSR